jgi:hypothetical protein
VYSLIFELQTGTMYVLFFCNLLHVETSLNLDFVDSKSFMYGLS